MIGKIIDCIIALFYPETWYLLLDKKVNIFTAKISDLRKWPLAEKLKFIDHVKGEERKQRWKDLLRINEKIGMNGEIKYYDFFEKK